MFGDSQTWRRSQRRLLLLVVTANAATSAVTAKKICLFRVQHNTQNKKLQSQSVMNDDSNWNLFTASPTLKLP